jgi:hypothetical protein
MRWRNGQKHVLVVEWVAPSLPTGFDHQDLSFKTYTRLQTYITSTHRHVVPLLDPEYDPKTCDKGEKLGDYNEFMN